MILMRRTSSPQRYGVSVIPLKGRALYHDMFGRVTRTTFCGIVPFMVLPDRATLEEHFPYRRRCRRCKRNVEAFVRRNRGIEIPTLS